MLTGVYGQEEIYGDVSGLLCPEWFAITKHDHGFVAAGGREALGAGLMILLR